MRWFDRVWTWQEKEVAKRATVIIGNIYISWERLRLSMLLFMGHYLSDNRQTPNRILPGREYLHVLDSLNISDSPDLLDVVINVRHRSTQHRRDKIFGVLGAAGMRKNPEDGAELHFNQLVNYGYLQTPELYKEFSRYWMKDRDDLRVLQACNPSKKRIAELPSWVADWSDTTPSYQLTTRLYNAAQDTKVNVIFHYHKNTDEIQLRGIQVDYIKTICHDDRLDIIENNFMNESAHWDPFTENLTEPYAALYCAGLYQIHRPSLLQGDGLTVGSNIRWDEPYAPTGKPIGEAFWRTLLGDHDLYARDSLNRRILFTTNACEIFDHFAHRKALSRGLWPKSVRERDVEISSWWVEKLQSSFVNKRFFITEKGYIGLAPSNARPGDLICVFLGGKVPFGLRERLDRSGERLGNFELVEEIYLHGYMDDRAIDCRNEGEMEQIDFCIR